MMISAKQYEEIRNQYGKHASFAVWAPQGDTVTSNTGVIDFFTTPSPRLLHTLQNDRILVGLNISRGLIQTEFANFHDSSSRSKDYKLRFALKDTELWGSYMTDFIKDFEEPNSQLVIEKIKEENLIQEVVASFRQEIDTINSEATLYALGSQVFNYLKRHFGKERKIVKLEHYSHFSSKEQYRERIGRALSN